MAVRHLQQKDLAERWRVSLRTLERWRWLGIGPAYIKIGSRVVYRLEDIEAYEAEQLRGRA
ncbi:helix-turn-helix domain-containing protein [Roseomonas terrae]|uniref:Helix-turn-helix domain-containing protein n=1 Tax=Neoroseomonas terrae TaxID=424799 RepID=A0ABS5ECJ6_9PROT|nr:helix-turn-helix domain-containing protein [Neoroseomonas terrae]MBR0648734.1 helix-turn-helix domain-containing protein [Neoroseomonas terrae]